jgi:hypothetical protein
LQRIGTDFSGARGRSPQRAEGVEMDTQAQELYAIRTHSTGRRLLVLQVVQPLFMDVGVGGELIDELEGVSEPGGGLLFQGRGVAWSAVRRIARWHPRVLRVCPSVRLCSLGPSLPEWQLLCSVYANCLLSVGSNCQRLSGHSDDRRSGM